MHKKILLAGLDDTSLNFFRDSMGDMFDIQEAGDINQAHQFLMKQYKLVKIVLITYKLFCSDNYQFMSHIENNVALGQIPIICISEAQQNSEQSKIMERDAYLHGAVDFLAPPFDTTIIENRIRNLIKLHDNASFANITNHHDSTANYSKDSSKGTFWNPDSLESMMMNAYVGAVCIMERMHDNISILRVNDHFSKELLGMEASVDSEMCENLVRHLGNENRTQLTHALSQAVKDQKETVCVLNLQRIHGLESNIHIRMSIKLIDHVGERQLFYCTIYNETEKFEAKRRESALMTQLQVIIQNVNGGITATYGDTEHPQYIYANERFYSIFGYTKEEFESELKNGINDLILTEYVDIVKTLQTEQAAGQDAIQMEYVAHKKDGSLIWIHSRSSICNLIFVDKPVYITVYEDVTITKRTEERIRNLNEKLGNSEVFLQVDITNHTIEDYYSKYETPENIMKWKQGGQANLDHIKASIYESDLEATLHEISFESLQKHYNAGNTKFSIEYRRHMPNGEIHWFCANTILIEGIIAGTVNAFIYCHDIDLRMKKRLARNKIVDTDIDEIALINIDTKEARAVKVCQESLIKSGDVFSFEENTQNFIKKRVAEENRARCEKFFVLNNIIDTINKQGYADCSFWILRDDGISRRKSTHISYLDITHKDLLMVGQDITELFVKEQAQQLVMQHAVEMANEANSAKSDFLARMSHDMRTPLNAIMGLIELAEKENCSNEMKEYLSSIDISSQYLLGLINDSLDLSKIESGKMELSEAPYNIDEFLIGVNTVIKPLMDANKIHFKVSLKRDTNDMVVDKLRFNQVFYNLLSNAAKYTKEGGHVEFTSESIPKKDGKSGLRFIVRDDGIGMSPEYLKVLFDPFTQENRPEIKERRGSGLGLAIVKRIIDATGGKISVESEVGKGTTFTVDVYAYNLIHQTEQPVKAIDKLELEKLQGVRILLVDDTDINIMVNEKVLASKGCIVETACNGLEAVNNFINSTPYYYDIILTDIRMPVMDGLEEVRRIRALDRPDAKTIPIVALTADTYADVQDKTQSAGMNARLMKPIHSDVLYGTVIRLVEEEHAARKKL